MVNNIFEKNPTINFFMENATYQEKKRLRSLTEADLSNVSNNLVSKLYRSAIDKAHIDFEDIPMTKGDITRYSGYTDMMGSLAIVEEIARKSNTKIPEIDVVLRAVNNITALREIYTKGYSLNNEFIMLQYCTMVATCVEATSGIIASFVDYVKTVDAVEFRIINPTSSPAAIAVSNLTQFNASVASGEYEKILNIILKNGNDVGIVKESALVITAAVITGVVSLVILMRQIVFRFFYMRMKLSDYLKLQATFLEMNRTNVMAKETRLSPDKKKQVVKKQKELADKLMKMSDKLKVESTMADSKVRTEMKKENSTYSLDDMTVNKAVDNFELL